MTRLEVNPGVVQQRKYRWAMMNSNHFALLQTAHITLMYEQLEQDEEWAIEQVVGTGSLAQEASSYEEHSYEAFTL